MIPQSEKAPRWTHEQIRAARIAPLAPLLKKRGLQMLERPAQNIELPAFKGLIVKDSHWRWPEQNIAGNAIDFFVQVLGLSFNEAILANKRKKTLRQGAYDASVAKPEKTLRR